MKGLAKRNNKIRGKTTRKRKSGGGGTFSNMTDFQQEYDDLVNDHKKAVHKYEEILNKTDLKFKKLEQKFADDYLHKESGYEETKNVEPQHKKKKNG